jgi:hypothetical protein
MKPSIEPGRNISAQESEEPRLERPLYLHLQGDRGTLANESEHAFLLLWHCTCVFGSPTGAIQVQFETEEATRIAQEQTGWNRAKQPSLRTLEMNVVDGTILARNEHGRAALYHSWQFSGLPWPD